MTIDDIQDAKVGSSQVTAIYLGDTLLWPTVAYTYEVSNVVITYSRGSALDAGAVGSNYTGNYAMASGTVTVKSGSTVVDTKYNEPLSISESSSFLVVVIEGGRDVVKGYNLRNNVTQSRSAEISVYYRTSTPISGGYVTQTANTDSVTTSVTHTTGDPVITEREVSGTRYAVLSLYGYKTSSDPCPASGGYTSMSYYGGHNVADYSSTPTYEWTTYHHNYTSGYTEDEGPYLTDTEWSNPVKVSSERGITDTLTLSTLPSWLHYNTSNERLTVDSEGQTRYENGRSQQIIAYNDTVASTPVTVYQQYNVIEDVTEAYDMYVSIQRSGNIPAVGGTFSVNYHARKTTTSTYTSGSPTVVPDTVTATLESSPNSPITTITDPSTGTSISEVTGPLVGNGTANLNVQSSAGAQRYISVYLTKVGGGPADSDTRIQDAANFPKGQIYPVVARFPQIVSPTKTNPAGRIQIHWLWTSGTTPTPTYPLTVTFTNLVYHFTFDGSQQEYTESYVGQIEATFTANDTNFYPEGKFAPMLEGRSGRCWFTADSVTGIVATYPTDKTWEVPESTPPLDSNP